MSIYQDTVFNCRRCAREKESELKSATVAKVSHSWMALRWGFSLPPTPRARCPDPSRPFSRRRHLSLGDDGEWLPPQFPCGGHPEHRPPTRHPERTPHQLPPGLLLLVRNATRAPRPSPIGAGEVEGSIQTIRPAQHRPPIHTCPRSAQPAIHYPLYAPRSNPPRRPAGRFPHRPVENPIHNI